MYLNTIEPAIGSKKTAMRVGRGIGSGKGKTCGRGHKGQHARAGGYHKVGFEGGQMPLQRRLPKFGFTSRKSLQRAEIRLNDLNDLDAAVIDIEVLKAANVIKKSVKFVKVVLSGEITKAVTLSGIGVTLGARKAIEALGGKIEA